MIYNRSAPSGIIIPTLIYDDVAAAIDWLCSVFGFTERLRATSAEGTVEHAQLAYGRSGIMLGKSRTGQGFASASDRTVLRPPDLHESCQNLLVRVADVDGHFERAARLGALILQPPTTYPFGERQYSALDLANHRWTFSQAIADVDPADWGAQVVNAQSAVAAAPLPRFCYLEIPTADIHQSVLFYEAVFGWTIRNRNSHHPKFDDATGLISGTWVEGRPAASTRGLLAYIWVENIDATLGAIAAHGGEVLSSPHLDSPGGEWIATFRDPAGNMFGLYQEGAR